MKIITIQPERVQDATSPGGRPLYRLPYPFHVTETGEVTRQDFWRGDPKGVIGFQNDVDVQQVDVWWHEVVKDPQLAVGKFPVMSQKGGEMYTYTVAIGSVNVIEGDAL